MLATVPSLSIDGFINNKYAQVSKLFLYFMASKYSQSNAYYRDITSLDYILANYRNGNELKYQIEQALMKLYGRYFDKAEILVNVEEPINTGYLNLYITGKLTDGAETYSLTKEVNLVKGDVTSYNNMLDKYYSEYVGE